MDSMFQGGRSSQIEMTLCADGNSCKVTHSAPGYLLLEESACLNQGEAKLVISIDGNTQEISFLIAEPVNGKRVEALALEEQAARIA